MVYKLPTEFRSELRNNIGEIIDENQLKDKIKGRVVAVGDEVTLTLKKVGIEPDICIVDFKSGRKKFGEEQQKKIKKIGEQVLKVVNPPEVITNELWESISRGYSSKKRTRIEVEGEEKDINSFLNSIEKESPPLANISDIKISEKSLNLYKNFKMYQTME